MRPYTISGYYSQIREFEKEIYYYSAHFLTFQVDVVLQLQVIKQKNMVLTSYIKHQKRTIRKLLREAKDLRLEDQLRTVKIQKAILGKENI